MTEKWKTWRGRKRKEIGGIGSEWERTERRYIEAATEWREHRALPELLLAAHIMIILTKGTTCGGGEN